MGRLKAGIIGAGNISGIYIKNLLTMFEDTVELCAIANSSPAKAQAAAQEYGIDFAPSPRALLERPDISIILNLTPPQAHLSVALAALEAGKHIYNEKPLCADLAGAEAVLALARKNNVRVSCAPDTFLGASLQLARKLIDEGWIGRPVAGTAFLMNHGPEHWHPSPAFYYQAGGGPLFDMGPYYLTALVSLLGPVARVSSSGAAAHPTRTITSAPQYGTLIKVETPTHISATLDFVSGAVVTLVMSFDVRDHSHPHIEIYGTEATLEIGDPNYFTSPIWIKRPHDEDWQEISLGVSKDERYLERLASDNWRGIGVSDLASAIDEDRPHRASGELAFHVLEVMTRILESNESGRRLNIYSHCERPDIL